MNKKDKIVFLRGEEFLVGVGEQDYEEYKNTGIYECIILNNLYHTPEKIKELKDIDPEYIYINTTGMFVEKIEVIMSNFNELNYIPKGVIFGTEKSAFSLLGIARKLKSLGCVFYESDLEGGIHLHDWI